MFTRLPGEDEVGSYSMSSYSPEDPWGLFEMEAEVEEDGIHLEDGIMDNKENNEHDPILGMFIQFYKAIPSLVEQLNEQIREYNYLHLYS